MSWLASADFVGRTTEMGILDRLLDLVAAGTGGSVLLSGEPGIGKSRLATEAADNARSRGMTVVWGRCRESSTAPPLWPWIQGLRRLGVRPPSPRRSLDEPSERFALFEEIADAVRASSERAPLLLVLDDLHRADEASASLLSFAMDGLWPGSFGLVAAYRGGEVTPASMVGSVIADLARLPGCQQLRLEGLQPAEVEMWVTTASEGSLTAQAPGILARTGGNPLFIAEVVRFLLAGGADASVPPSLLAAVATRVAALPEPTRDALRIAALLGREFDYAPIAAAQRANPAAVLDALEPAVTAELIAPDPARSGSYRFAHVLVAEAIEAELPPSRRAHLHADTFHALRDTASGAASDLAHHALLARPVVDDEVIGSAIDDAADEAESLAAWEDASFWRAQLLDVCGPTPARALRLGRSLLLAGQVDGARARFEAAAAGAATGGDAETLAAAALGIGDCVAEITADRGLIGWLDRALADPGVDEATSIRLAARRGMATYWLPGARLEARQRTADALSRAVACRDRRALGDALVARQFTLRGPDLLADRLRAGEEGLALADAAGDDELRFRAYQWLVPDRFQAGNVAGTRDAVAAMGDIAASRRDPTKRWWELVYQGLLAGFAASADTERLVEEAAALGRRLGVPAADAYRLGQLTRLWWRTARLAELVGELDEITKRFPGLPTLQCDLALALAAAGDTRASTAICRRLAADELGALQRDSLFLASAAILGQAVIACRRPELAPPIIAALEPYATRNLIQGVPVGWGAAAWHLAQLHHLLGHEEAAARDANVAADLHERWGADGYGDALPSAAVTARPLSRREAEVITLMANGRANKEIASTLHVSVHTIERHVANIFVKIGVRNRSEATAWALRRGMVS